MSSENISQITTTTHFIPPHPLNTAVLFIIFNRPDTTKHVFEAIRTAKPPRLYVAADGPRADKPGEVEKVEQVRQIATTVDWDCDVKTLFRDENLGCRVAVSSAIDWFFENEEEGIILEDDCLPSQSFFWFCEELLKRYRGDMRVWHIAGNNFHFGWQRDEDYSYYFGGIYGSIWGWASWRDRWEYYDVEIKTYDEVRKKGYLFDIIKNPEEAKIRISNFDEIKNGFDTWDYQWVYCRLINNGLTIVPSKNLVKNLGFGLDGAHTHSKRDKRSNMNIEDINLPLRHPEFFIRDVQSENRFFDDFMKTSILSKCKSKLKRVLNWAKK